MGLLMISETINDICKVSHSFSNEEKEFKDFVNKAAKDKCIKFLKDHGIEENNYYLVVGRFVPENNIELILTTSMLKFKIEENQLKFKIEENQLKFKIEEQKLNFKINEEQIKFNILEENIKFTLNCKK